MCHLRHRVTRFAMAVARLRPVVEESHVTQTLVWQVVRKKII
jgi:hypothetical protein